jgi:hypothetical protein
MRIGTTPETRAIMEQDMDTDVDMVMFTELVPIPM